MTAAIEHRQNISQEETRLCELNALPRLTNQQIREVSELNTIVNSKFLEISDQNQEQSVSDIMMAQRSLEKTIRILNQIKEDSDWGLREKLDNAINNLVVLATNARIKVVYAIFVLKSIPKTITDASQETKEYAKNAALYTFVAITALSGIAAVFIFVM